MVNDKDDKSGRIVPANNNDSAKSNAGGIKPDAGTWQRIDRATLTLARIVGRRMAREDFERLIAANDNNNRPTDSDSTEDGADTG
jgi:hypothetical protein